MNIVRYVANIVPEISFIVGMFVMVKISITNVRRKYILARLSAILEFLCII